MENESTTPVVQEVEQHVVAEKHLSSAETDKPRRPRKAPKPSEAVTLPETPPVSSETPSGGATAVLADLTVTPPPPSDGRPRSVTTYPDGITVIHH